MEKPYDIYDYVVLDRNGQRLGPITGFWIDPSTGQPEFASVKTGWLVGKQHIIPIRDAHFDYGSKMLRVPYDARVIKEAPGFGANHDLTPAEEERVYGHYRLERGFGRTDAAVADGTLGRGRLGEREDIGRLGAQRTAEIPLHEERVSVGKETVETGQVRLRKIVKTDTVNVPVELTRERIEIERLPASELRGTYSGRPWREAFTDDEIVMTERREEPVIEKTREVVGGVRATKEVDTERRNVSANVRREDVEIDRDADATRRGTRTDDL